METYDPTIQINATLGTSIALLCFDLGFFESLLLFYFVMFLKTVFYSHSLFVVKEDSRFTRGESQPHNKITNKQVIYSMLSKCFHVFSLYSDQINHFMDILLDSFNT